MSSRDYAEPSAKAGGSGLGVASRLIGRPRIPILYYHEIGTERGRHVVHPDDFAAQVQWLVEDGFEILTMDAVAELYEGRRKPPRRPLALTFDDGRRGVLEHALPVLVHHRIPATCYVVTDWLEGRSIPEHERYSGFLEWGALDELLGGGMAVGSHTLSHRNLKKIPAHEVWREVADSRRLLEDRLARPVPHFSFPSGRSPREVVRAVRRAGYRTAVATGQRSNGPFARIHRLRRLRVDGSGGPGELQRLLGDS
ncbi:MAG: polysaccharide deacetylase family protein [Myxococcota bacterium]